LAPSWAAGVAPDGTNDQLVRVSKKRSWLESTFLQLSPIAALRGVTMGAESAPALAQREHELAGLKTQVLARLNHGIQTPLTGIPGRIDLLLQTALDGQQTASQLQAPVASFKS